MLPSIEESPIDVENPEWTEAMFARAQAAYVLLPPEILSQFVNTSLSKRHEPNDILPSAKTAPEPSSSPLRGEVPAGDEGHAADE